MPAAKWFWDKASGKAYDIAADRVLAPARSSQERTFELSVSTSRSSGEWLLLTNQSLFVSEFGKVRASKAALAIPAGDASPIDLFFSVRNTSAATVEHVEVSLGYPSSWRIGFPSPGWLTASTYPAPEWSGTWQSDTLITNVQTDIGYRNISALHPGDGFRLPPIRIEFSSASNAFVALRGQFSIMAKAKNVDAEAIGFEMTFLISKPTVTRPFVQEGVKQGEDDYRFSWFSENFLK